MDLIRQRLEELRERFVDISIVVTMATGMSSNTFAFLRDYPQSFGLGFWIRTVVLLMVAAVYLLRKRLGIEWKARLVVLFLSAFFLTSITGLGFYSPMKVFILFSAITITFIMPRRWTLTWVALLSMVYFISSFALIHGWKDYRKEPADLFVNFAHWWTEVSIIAMCAFTVIFIINRFRIKLTETSSELNSQNIRLEENRHEINEYNTNLEKLIEEKTRDLAGLVEQHAAENRSLKSVNASVNRQNREIAEANSRLKLVREKLIMSDRLSSLGLLTSGVCHEIRKPLQEIESSVARLEQQLGVTGLSGSDARLTGILKTGVARIRSITDSLDQADRISYAADELVDLVAVVNDCRNELDHFFKQGVNWNFKYEHDSISVKLNKALLRQVILNILQNALEAVAPGSEIHVDILTSSQKVIVEITDNGHGISKSHLPIVTDPFFTTKPTDQHSGLGLYLVQKMMTETGGKMTIQSSVGEGTVVCLIFTPLSNPGSV